MYILYHNDTKQLIASAIHVKEFQFFMKVTYIRIWYKSILLCPPIGNDYLGLLHQMK
jgi:hypothetical protein